MAATLTIAVPSKGRLKDNAEHARLDAERTRL